MKKKTVKMAVSLGALIALSGTYLGVRSFMQQQEKQEAEAGQEEKTTVASIDTEEITSVNFMVDKEETTFLKKEDSWSLKEDEKFPVEQTVLNDAVDSLASLEADRVLKDVKNLEEYGLNTPSNTISLDASDEKGVISLQIGDLNESVNQYYVSMNQDDSTVYLVSSEKIDPFMKSLYDYAEMSDFPAVDSAYVRRISVEKEENPYVLEEESEISQWNVSSSGEKEKADSAAAGSLASSVSTLSYLDFVDYHCEDPEEYGLETPFATVKVNYEEEVEKSEEETEELPETTEEETEELSETTENEISEETPSQETENVEMVEKQLILEIGDESEDNSRYVRINDSEEVYTISNDSLAAFLDKSEEDFWDMSITHMVSSDLDKMQVTYHGETKTIDVSHETSTDEEGEESETVTYLMGDEKLDNTDFSTFFNKITAMSAQKRERKDYQPEGDPEMVIEVTCTNRENDEKIEYYSYDTNYYAVVTEDRVYLVNKLTVKELFEAYETLTEEKTDENVEKEGELEEGELSTEEDKSEEATENES